MPYLPTSNSSSSGGESVLVYDATVTAVGNGDGATRDHVYVADGSYTVVINDGYEGATAEIGDRVGFSTSLFATVNGERTVDRTSGWTILSSDNPVYVRELGAATIDYEARLSEVTHLYGEVTRKSSYDCGSGYACFIVDHGGTENLVRVKATNSFGLGADYDGGLCAEVVAPVSMYTGSKGNAEFLDVMDSDWMRTWAAE